MSRPIRSIHELGALVESAAQAEGVRRGDLNPGDVLMLYTQNSIYTARVLSHNKFRVSGGWFDLNNMPGFETTIVGCTWGGSSIHRDFVASCGMRTEFGNRVLTSILQRVVRIPAPILN
ncbi:MAG: hypothetical protein E2O84_02405 [Bacteroidetes bacterium]|nr:MAG: hypothetical protein E2O84_02405 [Bacteroidota bacterium]